MKISYSVNAIEEHAARSVRGSDLIVYLEGQDKTPVAVTVNERHTEQDLRQQFGGDDAVVFVKNKNLQHFPAHLRGAILWVSFMEIIAVVIKSNGQRAFVERDLVSQTKEGRKMHDRA